jgi:hypothetical protein
MGIKASLMPFKEQNSQIFVNNQVVYACDSDIAFGYLNNAYSFDCYPLFPDSEKFETIFDEYDVPL